MNNYSKNLIFILLVLSSCTISSSKRNLFRIDKKGMTVHYFIQKEDSLIFESNRNSHSNEEKYRFVSFGHTNMPKAGESIVFQKFTKQYQDKFKNLVVESHKVKGSIIIKNHKMNSTDGFSMIVLEIDLKAYHSTDTNKLISVFEGTAEFKQQGYSSIFYYTDQERINKYKKKHELDIPGSIVR